jgi:hypothetical protein
LKKIILVIIPSIIVAFFVMRDSQYNVSSLSIDDMCRLHGGFVNCPILGNPGGVCAPTPEVSGGLQWNCGEGFYACDTDEGWSSTGIPVCFGGGRLDYNCQPVIDCPYYCLAGACYKIVNGQIVHSLYDEVCSKSWCCEPPA